jgi:hypothetical protein
MRCCEMVTRIERVASRSLLVDFDAVLSSLSMEEGGIMSCGESFEVSTERWAHFIENLLCQSSQNDFARAAEMTDVRCACPHRIAA